MKKLLSVLCVITLGMALCSCKPKVVDKYKITFVGCNIIDDTNGYLMLAINYKFTNVSGKTKFITDYIDDYPIAKQGNTQLTELLEPDAIADYRESKDYYDAIANEVKVGKSVSFNCYWDIVSKKEDCIVSMYTKNDKCTHRDTIKTSKFPNVQ